ncbi:hypothetical protein LL946_07180 [Knoellia locipacati]|uniref:hypothetical protein n=1 Tax=Knoellia locipacati TaxID=882824 RepID=UPI003850E399
MSTHDDDNDPTGMRSLLRGLPDPGPMPDDLVARIHSSLAELTDSDVTVSDLGDTAGARSGGGPVSRGTDDAHRPVRPAWWVRYGPRAVVAAVVLVGGGAVVSGQLGLGGSGNDSSTMSADSSSGGRAEGLSEDGTDSAPQAGRDTADSGAGTAEPGPVVVTMSGRPYTVADLAGEVLAVGSATPTAPLTAESPGIGPIGTEIGVRSCLVALGLPRDTGARVDLALVEGTPAAVVVVTREGGRTAYAVGRECTLGNPALLAGPVDLP